PRSPRARGAPLSPLSQGGLRGIGRRSGRRGSARFLLLGEPFHGTDRPYGFGRLRFVPLLEHHGEGRTRPVAPAQGIAAELEATPERGRLEKSVMAGGAWRAGLAREGWEENGAPRRKADNQRRGNR